MATEADNGTGQVLRKAPNSVIVICATMVVVALIASITVLSLYNHNTDDLFRFLNTIMNGIGFVSSTGAFLYAGAAAKQSQTAVQQTNGGLDKRIERAVARMIAADRQDNGGRTDG